MLKRIATFACALLVAGTMTSCIFDPEPSKKPPGSGGDGPAYGDLTEVEHVITNLELAYTERNIDRYSELFDDAFIFHFSPGDVGDEVPSQWGKAEELASARNMFSGAGESPIIDIELNLSTEGTEWRDYTSPDFPGETLKRITGVVYDFRITTSVDLTYITSGAPKAQFIAREVDGKWKLVTWFDQADS